MVKFKTKQKVLNIKSVLTDVFHAQIFVRANWKLRFLPPLPPNLWNNDKKCLPGNPSWHLYMASNSFDSYKFIFDFVRVVKWGQLLHGLILELLKKLKTV